VVDEQHPVEVGPDSGTAVGTEQQQALAWSSQEPANPRLPICASAGWAMKANNETHAMKTRLGMLTCRDLIDVRFI